MVLGAFFTVVATCGWLVAEAIRNQVSAAVMVLYLFCTDRRLLKIRLRDCGYFVGTGIFSLVFFNWCYFTAIEKSSLSVAAVLLYTSPIFVMLFSAVLFHEKLTKPKLAALAMTFAGCVLVTGLLSGEHAAISPAGALFGLGSGLGYALYSIFGKYALEKYDSATVSAYTFVFAAAAALPLARLDRAAALLLQPATLWGALGIGVLCCMLPFLFYTKGLSYVEAGRAAVIATLEPAVATVLGILLFHETMTLSKFCGIALIFGAIVVLNQKQKP